MTKRPNAYKTLAVYLAPDDAVEGARQIDAAILALQRARYRPHNLHRAVFWLALILLALSMTILVAQIACWLDPLLWRTLLGIFAVAVPILAAKLLFIGAFLYLIFYCTQERVEDYGPLPQPPPPIYEWLIAHGKSDLRYWHEIYWPYPKLLAHRKELLGFVFWRKNPRPADQCAAITARFQAAWTRPDANRAYLESVQGRADSEAYLVSWAPPFTGYFFR